MKLGIFLPLFYVVMLSAQESAVMVRDAWVQLPLPSKTETAVYLVIENHSAQKRALVAAVSEAARKLELHQMRMDGRIMVMTPVSAITIPAHGKASLSPSGFHMMMYGLKTRPNVGDKVDITLMLDDGTSIPVTAVVKK